eukprot:CAMPEP_0171277074 /NCGR_PEP_ID=MMETSP0790-20130122/64166_1 /TAXON_ID=2925 /ORGANISM="Alexandrium catenella, Strain OF101" /LENGTH=317 /DNA_ID=CAMNT_0011746189 /DNA_START=335 /DNA_END=1286 /DNA_ORIENTATION=+
MGSASAAGAAAAAAAAAAAVGAAVRDGVADACATNAGRPGRDLTQATTSPTPDQPLPSTGVRGGRSGPRAAWAAGGEAPDEVARRGIANLARAMLPRVPQAAAEEGLLFGVPAKGVGAVVRPGHLGRVAAVVDAGRAHDPEQHAEGVEVAVEGVGPVEEDSGAAQPAVPEAPRGVGREDVQAPKAKVQELRVATGVEAHVVVLQVAQQRPHARVEVLEPQEDLRKERLCRGLGHDALRAGGCKVLHRRAKIDTHRGAWAGAIIHRDEEQRLCGQVHDIVDAHYAWVGPLPDALGDLALTCRRAAPLHESLHRKARPP